MTLAERRSTLEAELQQARSLRERAVRSVDEATAQVLRLEGALGVVLEMERDRDGES